MGQMAVGILYGCEAPKLPPDEDYDVYDEMIQDFHNFAKIAWNSSVLRVRLESEGGKPLFGVWVTVGGSGEDGTPYFLDGTFPLADAEAVYHKHIVKAKKLWDRFAAWVKKNKATELPPATLWLTPCETA